MQEGAWFQIQSQNSYPVTTTSSFKWSLWQHGTYYRERTSNPPTTTPSYGEVALDIIHYPEWTDFGNLAALDATRRVVCRILNYFNPPVSNDQPANYGVTHFFLPSQNDCEWHYYYYLRAPTIIPPTSIILHVRTSKLVSSASLSVCVSDLFS